MGGVIHKEIKLEDNSNELEILEFMVGNVCFGINVIKVREIVNAVTATKVPESHPCVEGVFKFRGEVISLVNLNRYLGFESSGSPQNDKIIVAEFNLTRVAFRVNNVERIHRVSWDQLKKTPDLVQIEGGYTTGILKMRDGRIILMIDFEKIMLEINPSILEENLRYRNMAGLAKTARKILIVEDSFTLRQILFDYLPEIGYTNLELYENGQLAWNYLEKLINKKGPAYKDEVCMVITDIEMPQMGGHHLIKKIKEHPILKDIPVVIFSSLITDDLRHKGESVGANAQVSKPHFRDLAEILDKLLV